MFEGKPILIVEDQCFTALDLANAVEDWNGRVVGPAASVEEALTLLGSHRVAAAILDAKLGDRDITPVALRLAEQGLPFVIHTGTGLPDELAMAHPHLPVVIKPVKPLVVLARLLDEMRDPGRRWLPELDGTAAAKFPPGSTAEDAHSGSPS